MTAYFDRGRRSSHFTQLENTRLYKPVKNASKLDLSVLIWVRFLSSEVRVYHFIAFVVY